MAYIELPRALDDYFAFAETTSTRNGRRFVISLPYFNGAKLDRLQWWYHVGPEQERQMGEAAIATFRAQATERFRRHIERWLENTRQRLHGDDPIPRIESLVPQSADLPAHAPPPTGQAPPDAASVSVTVSASPSAAAIAAAAPPPAVSPPSNIVEWPSERVANG
jgi:hypothetical protein